VTLIYLTKGPITLRTIPSHKSSYYAAKARLSRFGLDSGVLKGPGLKPSFSVCKVPPSIRYRPGVSDTVLATVHNRPPLLAFFTATACEFGTTSPRSSFGKSVDRTSYPCALLCPPTAESQYELIRHWIRRSSEEGITLGLKQASQEQAL